MLTLRPYQQSAIDAIYGYFAENAGHPLVVIPTAGGKSLVVAAFIEGVLRAWPDQRILVVTHVRELIAQNFGELIGLWRDAPAGIYSAGLGRRDLGARILFAGIQSIHRRAYDVQQCDLVLIDEAHLIPGASDTMYRRFLDTLTRFNPHLKVIGFTATPYRLDSGMLHEGKGALFTDIAFDVSVRQLIDDGYLCPLVSKAAETKLDVSGVGSRGGEFIPGQLQAAVDLPEITEAAIDEVVRLGADRHVRRLFDIPAPSQTIQPWQYGHPETKATCLWLKGPPRLTPTRIVEGREARVHREPPGPERWRNRSRTFEGIAAAMADQWGAA